MRKAIYAGSFDPLTNGHVDILKRGLEIFDQVILAIANNPNKKHFFDVKERIALAHQATQGLEHVVIDTFDGLLVDYAKTKNATALLRGLRAPSDFEYEFQLAMMNRRLAPQLETTFLMTGEEYFYLSSRLIKEVASFGGDVEHMVPQAVYKALQVRFGGGQT